MQLVCSQTKDATNNKSFINWTLSSVGGEVNYYATGPTTVTINGQQVYYKAATPWDSYEFPAKKGSVSGSLFVSHEEDGSKTITVSLKTAIYNLGRPSTDESNWQLDTIPRGAMLTDAPSTFSNADLPTIKYTNPFGDSATKVEVCIADSNGMDGYAPYRDLVKGGTSYTFKSSDMVLLNDKVATNSQNLSVTFVIHTITADGKEYYHSKPSTYKMVETDDTQPSVRMSLSVINPPTFPSSLAGLYVQGKSSVKVDLTPTFKYGATAFGYSATVGGVLYSNPTSPVNCGVLTKSGNVEVVGRVLDSRMFDGTASQSITVLEYSKPLVIPNSSETAILCYRCAEGSEEPKGNSTSVRVKARRSFYPLGGSNACSLQWRRRLTSSAEWSEWKDLIPSAAPASYECNFIVATDFALTSSYVMQILATDSVGETDTKEIEIPTQDVALHLGAGGTKVTIGEYCDSNQPDHTFRTAWDFYRKSTETSEWVLQDGIEEDGASGMWTYRKWRSGLAECWVEYAFRPSSTGDNAITVAYPFPMTTTPIVNLTPSTNGNLCSCVQNCDASGNNTNRNTQLNMLVRGVTNASYLIGINIRVLSRWK